MGSMTCATAEELLVASVLSDHPTPDGPELSAHLAGCSACTTRHALTVDALAACASTVPQQRPPDRLRAAIMRDVHADVAAHAVAAAAEATAEVVPARPIVVPARSGEVPTRPAEGAARSAARALARRPRWHRARTSRAFRIGGALAVAAAALLLVAGHASRGPAGNPAPVAAVRTVNLLGGPAQPGIQGTLTWDAQTQLAQMQVRGIATAGPSDAVYEVWLLHAGSAPKAASFLVHEPDGTWQASFSGNPSAYQQVAVTREPAGGSITPTGPEIFSGSMG